MRYDLHFGAKSSEGLVLRNGLLVSVLVRALGGLGGDDDLVWGDGAGGWGGVVWRHFGSSVQKCDF
jgi:hypothetical protein